MINIDYDSTCSSIIPLPRYAPTLVDNGRESQIFIPRLCLIFPLTVNCHRTSVFNNDSPKKTTVQNDRLTGLWNRVAMYMYNRFYTIRQCDGQTDGQADIYKYRTSDKYTREKLWGMNGIGTHPYMKFPPQNSCKDDIVIYSTDKHAFTWRDANAWFNTTTITSYACIWVLSVIDIVWKKSKFYNISNL